VLLPFTDMFALPLFQTTLFLGALCNFEEVLLGSIKANHHTVARK